MRGDKVAGSSWTGREAVWVELSGRWNDEMGLKLWMGVENWLLDIDELRTVGGDDGWELEMAGVIKGVARDARGGIGFRFSR